MASQRIAKASTASFRERRQCGLTPATHLRPPRRPTTLPSIQSVRRRRGVERITIRSPADGSIDTSLRSQRRNKASRISGRRRYCRPIALPATPHSSPSSEGSSALRTTHRPCVLLERLPRSRDFCKPATSQTRRSPKLQAPRNAAIAGWQKH